MTLRLRGDSIFDYLDEKATATPRRPTATPRGMCVLSGQILRQNLKTHLNRTDVPTHTLAHYTTIEELASTLLEGTDQPTGMLPGGLRDRLVESIFEHADPANATASGETLDPAGVLDEASRRGLVELADRLPYEEDETRETLLDEFDDYLRATDARADEDDLIRVLETLENRFARVQSERSIAAFRGLERLIQTRIAGLATTRQQSRSHLVRSGREAIDGRWPAEFSHVEWIAVAGIGVFDNPTLRFLAAIADHPDAPDVEVFLGDGTVEYHAARLDALDVETDVESARAADPTDGFDSEDAAALFRATRDATVSPPPSVEFVEAPTDRRVVERLADMVRTQLQNGVDPHDVLVVAPDAGSYQSLIEDAFETVGVPVHVETRRSASNIPAYRFLDGFVHVLARIATDEPITYDDLVAPLRLGYCRPGAGGGRWPISGRELTAVEQELHRRQQSYNAERGRYSDQGIPFDEWRNLVEDIPDWTADWDAVEQYLDDLAAKATSPPTVGADLESTLGPYLGTYIHQTVDHERALYEGPGIDTTRTALTEIHATNLAEQVRGQLPAVAQHYDRVRELFETAPSWNEVGRALGSVIGGNTYGKSHRDGHAVPVVDAGNTFFRDASHVYVLGMNTGEFPGEAPTRTFLHRSLRQAVHESAVAGETPSLHLDSRATNYGEQLAFYQTTLQTARADAEVTLFHTYKDERGNEVAWSSFVDLFELAGENEAAADLVDRVGVGEWLAAPSDDAVAADPVGAWESVSAKISERERLRTLLYYAALPRPTSDLDEARAAITALTEDVDASAFDELVYPRVDRHRAPPTAVTIDPDEPAFDDIGLADVTGPPHQPHELDLASQCGLKYYYYQFLHNFEGYREPERDTIPKYYSSTPHYRLGELPYIVRENYADPRYVEKWQAIITDLLPDRQRDLMAFDSPEDLEAWVRDEDTFDAFDLNTIYSNLLAERDLVAAERENGIRRDWEWCSGGSVTIGDAEMAVPAYRVDRFGEGADSTTLPIFFTRFTNRARSALKACHRGKIWEADEHTTAICTGCDNHGRCRFHAKYNVDHRLLAGTLSETELRGEDVMGVGLQEQFAGPQDGNRVLAVKQQYIMHGPFESDADHFETATGRGFSDDWEDAVSDWKDNFTAAATALDPTSDVTLSVNPELVSHDECLDCVYADLCMVPNREVIDQ